MPNEILFKEKPVSELDAIRQIKAGEPLSEYSKITDLMAISALVAKGSRWKEIPYYAYTPRVCRLMVKMDFRAVNSLTEAGKALNRDQDFENMKLHCVNEVAGYAGKLTRDGAKDFAVMLNAQSDTFIKAVIRRAPKLAMFVGKKRFADIYGPMEIKNLYKSMNTDNFKKGTTIPDFTPPDFTYLNTDETAGDAADMEMTGAKFLALPMEQKTLEALQKVINSRRLLEPNFVEKLLVPNRNFAFYTKQGDAENAALWKAKMIPWMNKEICIHIAEVHPEGAITIPQLLTQSSVQKFFEYYSGKIPQQNLTWFFLKFPESVLTAEAAQYIAPTEAVLRHAPSIFAGTIAAEKFLVRNPGVILRMPAVYQTRKLLLTDGVPLTTELMKLIADPDLRALIQAAYEPNRPPAAMMPKKNNRNRDGYKRPHHPQNRNRRRTLAENIVITKSKPKEKSIDADGTSQNT